jgi:hypothetical protein
MALRPGASARRFGRGKKTPPVRRTRKVRGCILLADHHTGRGGPAAPRFRWRPVRRVPCGATWMAVAGPCRAAPPIGRAKNDDVPWARRPEAIRAADPAGTGGRGRRAATGRRCATCSVRTCVDRSATPATTTFHGRLDLRAARFDGGLAFQDTTFPDEVVRTDAAVSTFLTVEATPPKFRTGTLTIKEGTRSTEIRSAGQSST